MSEVNCLIGQSGGPTSVINGSVQGVIDAAVETDIDNIYGMKFGIAGALKGDLINLTNKRRSDLDLLKTTPSSILGTSRYKLGHYDDNEEDYVKLFELFDKHNIKYVFYIGGNDSMDTVDKLSSYAEEINSDVIIMGVPKTIDNDLVEIDHTPGYGSASRYIATSVMEIARDSHVYDVKNVHIVEVMGRSTGWLAASSILADTDALHTPDFIYTPETDFSIDKFITDVDKKIKEKKFLTVVVSEGIKDKNGDYISAGSSTKHDHFGHKRLGGAAGALKPYLKEHICDRVKAIKFDVMQRAAAHMASCVDLQEAYQHGKNAVDAAMAGETGLMVSLKRVSNDPYQVEMIKVPASSVANKVKHLPQKYINDEQNNIKADFKDYVLPLVQGDCGVRYKNSLPQYASIEHIRKADMMANK